MLVRMIKVPQCSFLLARYQILSYIDITNVSRALHKSVIVTSMVQLARASTSDLWNGRQTEENNHNHLVSKEIYSQLRL